MVRGSPTFKYLRLMVDVDPRKNRTCDPLVKLVSKRLTSWRNIFMSLGCMAFLLNLVLNSVLVFFLSFMKILVSV